jgi:hypothetical protein
VVPSVVHTGASTIGHLQGNAIDTHQFVYSKGTIKCKQSCPCTPCGCPLPTTNSILCGKDGKEYPTECYATCRYVYIVY